MLTAVMADGRMMPVRDATDGGGVPRSRIPPGTGDGGTGADGLPAMPMIGWLQAADVEAFMSDCPDPYGAGDLFGSGLQGFGLYSVSDGSGSLLIGNGGDLLVGQDGNDTLIGGGGDTLMGGLGDDLYIIASADDLIVEYDGEGHDTVQSSISFSLPPNIEVLHLVGSDPIDGRGNDLDNLIIGNDASNLLAGGGGANTLIGGAGDDWYEAGPNDIIIEEPDGGIDTLLMREEMPLPDNVENLVIIGAGPLNATGNELDNVIWGNAWDNILDGGPGADTLIGGYGNDTYIIDAWDTVIEEPDAGYDTILFAFGALLLPDNVEAAIYTGSGNVTLTGNALDNRLEGGPGDDTLDGGGGANVLVGGAGNDTYFVRSGDRIIEEPGGGMDTVYTTGSYTLDDNVEVLILTGAASASLRGNAGANLIIGNRGSNILDGGGGADTLQGGAGDDLYLIRSGLEVIIEEPGGGDDTVMSPVSYRLDPEVETLILTGDADIDGFGNASDNLIIGNSGNNWLGGGGGGSDTLMGGPGNDLYFYTGTETIIELPGEGRDTLWSAITATILPNIEVLQLGGNDPVNAYGGPGNDLLVGNDADNILDGKGGIDTLRGGGGNDLYIIDRHDVVIELPGEGHDTIRVRGSYELPANVEVLELLGDDRALLYGNALPNLIVGGPGDDTLVGRGGADTLIGGKGDDVYYSDGLDLIIELPGEGWDKIYTAKNITLPDNVEELILQPGAYSGKGNASNNILRGNDGDNHLTSGGQGHDTLIGGKGDDIYVVDSRDTVIEGPGGGHDHIMSRTSYTLPAWVEDLTLTGGQTGIGNELDNVIRGNAGDNMLYGQAGNDTLFGGPGNDTLSGGAGNDLLYGGPGADVFRFTRGMDTDKIADFEQGLDKIELRGMVPNFAALDIEDRNGHALIRFDDSRDYIYVINFDAALLGPSDFIFS